MRALLQGLVAWARVRGLRGGPMQTGRVEATEVDAVDDAPRPQDYGFASLPVEGEGLRLAVGGHTVLLRVDRAADRPGLAAYEVLVWHREGHYVRLGSGGKVSIECQQLEIVATSGTTIVSPTVAITGHLTATTITTA